jgi:hypothetical protein
MSRSLLLKCDCGKRVLLSPKPGDEGKLVAAICTCGRKLHTKLPTSRNATENTFGRMFTELLKYVKGE